MVSGQKPSAPSRPTMSLKNCARARVGARHGPGAALRSAAARRAGRAGARRQQRGQQRGHAHVEGAPEQAEDVDAEQAEAGHVEPARGAALGPGAPAGAARVPHARAGAHAARSFCIQSASGKRMKVRSSTKLNSGCVQTCAAPPLGVGFMGARSAARPGVLERRGPAGLRGRPARLVGTCAQRRHESGGPKQHLALGAGGPARRRRAPSKWTKMAALAMSRSQLRARQPRA